MQLATKWLLLNDYSEHLSTTDHSNKMPGVEICEILRKRIPVMIKRIEIWGILAIFYLNNSYSTLLILASFYNVVLWLKSSILKVIIYYCREYKFHIGQMRDIVFVYKWLSYSLMSIGFMVNLNFFFLWYQTKISHVWSQTTTHGPRHSICIYVLDLKIRHK